MLPLPIEQHVLIHAFFATLNICINICFHFSLSITVDCVDFNIPSKRHELLVNRPRYYMILDVIGLLVAGFSKNVCYAHAIHSTYILHR